MATQRTHTVHNDVKSEEIEEIEEIEIKEIEIDKIEIEELKTPYQYAIEGNWTGVVNYYETHRAKLVWPMNLDGDNVLHLAASSCSKSKCRRVLEILINLCWVPTAKSWCLRIPNIDGNNVLHQVSVSGSVEAAKFLVEEFNEPESDSTREENNALPLLHTRNRLGETPLYRAVALGHIDLVKFYLETLKEKNVLPEIYWQELFRDDKLSGLRMAVVGQHFEIAHLLLQSHPFLGEMKDENGLTSLQLLAQMPTAFEPHFQQSLWKMLIYHCLPVREDDVESGMDSTHHQYDVESSMDTNNPCQSIFRKKRAVVMKAYCSLWDSLAKESEVHNCIIYRIWKDKKNKKFLKKFIKLLVKLDRSWLITDKQETKRTISLGSLNEPKDGDDGGDKKKEATKLKKEARKEVYKSTPLLIATVTGNVPIVQEILEQHPQAVEHVNNENEHNILHLAIKNRQKKIFDLIKSKPIVMSKLSMRIDSNGNTILHQAADMSWYPIALSQESFSPAMQLQDELRWNLRVKEMLPPHYIVHHNKKNLTAEELFNNEHEELLKSAQAWTKEMARSCSGVAVVVATVVFAAAYTIPGGTNDQSGLPVLQKDPLFLLFTYMVVVAIACSLSSVAFFLSVLASPLKYPFFVNSFLSKFIKGFVFLFFAFLATLLAFVAIILLLIRLDNKWTMSILCLIAFFPVPLFGLLFIPMDQLFKFMAHWFFKPLLHLLYLLAFSRRD